MKRIILTLACASIFGASATFAQDTTAVKSQTPTQQPTQSSDQLRTDELKGWTQVQSTDIPTPVRTTLDGTQYKGWDQSGTVYKNSNGDYSLRMGAGATQKAYYFDKNGKTISKPMGKPDNK